MRKYLLELTVFLIGGVIMVLELCGSRLLSPFVVVSIVVWTALIGIILGALSLGYYFGGKLADKGYGRPFLGGIVFITAILVGLILILKDPVFLIAEQFFTNLTAQSIISTILLFAIPNVLLGMVTPLVVKLKMESLKTAGGTIGNLTAFSTIGSILGTFLTGFYLLSFFSVSQIIFGLSILLVLLSLFISSDFWLKKISIFLLFFFMIFFYLAGFSNPKLFVLESRYNHIQIFNTTDYKTGKAIKILNLDNKWDSAMFLDGDQELVFNYTKFYRLAKEMNPEAKKVLMIGGGAYSVPKDFLNRYSDVTVDTVELDPKLTEVAKSQFGLQENPRHHIFHEDGRTFLNRESKLNMQRYDAILMDAFKSYSIPFHLASKEAIQKMEQLLNEEGVVVANIISSLKGDKSGFLEAEVATYNEIFPHVYLFAVDSITAEMQTQNIMLVAKKGQPIKSFPSPYGDSFWHGELGVKPLLTDDFAPVDQYVIKAGI